MKKNPTLRFSQQFSLGVNGFYIYLCYCILLLTNISIENKSTTHESTRTTDNDEQTSLSNINTTLEQLSKTVGNLKTKATFEDTVKEILLTLTNQVKFLTNRNNNVSDNVDKVESDITRCD